MITEARHDGSSVAAAAARARPRAGVTVLRRGRLFAQAAASRALVGRSRSRTDPTAGRFTGRDARHLVRDAFAQLETHVAELPTEPTVGSRQNVLLAALTLSFLEVLEAPGVERTYAIELTGDICWRFYRHWGQVTKVVTAVASRDPVRRLRLSVNAFLTYPFGPPGYRFRDVGEPDGRSLDMLRCPVADYLATQQAGDLCVGSWCNLDYSLAEMWDATLQRSGTLAAGAALRLPLPRNRLMIAGPASGSSVGAIRSPRPAGAPRVHELNLRHLIQLGDRRFVRRGPC